MTKSLYICECFTHGFTVSVEDGQVQLVAWSYGTAGSRLGWWNRLRWVWQIMRHGQPYNDEMILEPQAAEKLAQALMGAAADADAKAT